MIRKYFFCVFLLNFFVLLTFAQEVEFPLSSNPVIKEYLKKNPILTHTALRTQSSVSLSLPFEDDFSTPRIYPNPQLWMDSDAFVNETFCDNPITIGVATLDGLNKLGEPHDSNATSTNAVICDYLTSRPIDLTSVAPADSVYFSFYYQPQGLGDEPEDGDSLVLQFYESNGIDSNWINIWVANGRPDSAFAEVRIKVDSLVYFWGGFQFRFYNYGTPNGNRDHWNIDYVKLKKNETYNQPLNEISLVYPIQSYLSDYTAMPYSHYKSEVLAGNNPVKSSINDVVKLYNFTGTTSLAINDTVWDGSNAVIFGAQSQPNLSPSQNSTDTFQIPLTSQLFTSSTSEYADFNIQHYTFGLHAGDPLFLNEESYFTQHFQNYYAYDDGSAESASGIPVAYSEYAYQFDVKMQDTLRGIQIYFNPWGNNVHQDLFSLCLWSSINVSANSDVLAYKRIDLKPANNDSINGFVNYYFDVPLVVGPGNIYVGIIQNTDNEIGIGVDHNTDSHSKMFVNYNNQWYQSITHGSWMMRPFFGKDLTIGIVENTSAQPQFEIYPNPASNKLAVSSRQSAINTISIYNLLGEKVLAVSLPTANCKLHTELDVSTLGNGIYFIQLSDKQNTFTETKKLIIQH